MAQEDGIGVMEEALRTAIQHFGPTSIECADATFHMGRAAATAANREAAVNAFVRAEKLYTLHFGRNHPKARGAREEAEKFAGIDTPCCSVDVMHAI